MTASPTPAPPTKGFDAGNLLRGVAHGLATAISNSPWLGVVLGLVVLVSITGFVRNVIHGGHPKDDVRLFSRADRRIIFERAGNRCEHYFPIFGRCRTTSGLQADHVHPHSRGGWTAVSNGQALCAQHNREKSARVPWDWQLARIAKRRSTYFAAGHEPLVVRYRPKTPRHGASPNSRVVAPAPQRSTRR